MSLRHFLRMSKWARHPPSAKRVKLVLGVVLICLSLFAVERIWGWPAALKVNSGSQKNVFR